MNRLTIPLICALASLLLPAAHAAAVPVVNGDFAEGSSSGWTTTGSVDYLPPGAFWAPYTPTSGDVDLDGGAPTGAISQDLSIPGAGTLDVSFAFTGNMYGGPTVKRLLVGLSGSSTPVELFLFDISASSIADPKWVLETASFSVPGAGTYSLSFSTDDAAVGGSAYGPVVTAISADLRTGITTTPDSSSTLLLLGCGLLGVASLRARVWQA